MYIATSVISLLVDTLKDSTIKDRLNLTGNIYALQRPLNSDKEDIVVNTLPLGYGAVQSGVVNINAFVPNKEVRVNNAIDMSQPDLVRLGQIERDLSEFLLDYWGFKGRYNFELQQTTIQQDANNQHYVNLRVIFRALNVY